MQRGFLIGIAVGLCGVGSVAAALDIQSIRATYVDDEYQVRLVARIEAPADKVQRVLRDYSNYPTLDKRIVRVQVEHSDDLPITGGHRLLLATRIRVCYMLFCRDVDRTEIVDERPFELQARVIPEKSDMLRGNTNTRLEPSGTDTLVYYDSTFVPKFWVPALFARSALSRTLQDASVAMFERIEILAKADTTP